MVFSRLRNALVRLRRAPRHACVGFAIAVLSTTSVSYAPAAAAAEPILVFAAASLTDALQAAARVWQQQSGQEVRFSFAASSTLARQIQSDAPADVFVSADELWMNEAERSGHIVSGSRSVLLGNRLAVIAPARDVRPLNCSIGQNLAAALKGTRLALGDPDHVPAGRYAQQSLAALGIWPLAQTELLRADNVRAALAWVERGEAPFGIVYSTDARSTPRVGTVCTLPANTHAPIVYPIALVKHGEVASPAARAFVQWLKQPQARAIFNDYGFTEP